MVLGVGYLNTYLGVDRDAGCLLRISGGVDVDRAQAVRVPHDGDPRAILNVADEAVAAARDNEINVLVELQEGRHFGSSLDRLNVGRWDGCFRKSCLDSLGEQLGSLVGLFAPLQDSRVTWDYRLLVEKNTVCGRRQI